MSVIKIASSSNFVYKNTKKLLNVSGRKKTRKFIIEGERIVTDACKNGASIDYIIFRSDYDYFPFEDKYKCFVLEKKLFDTLKSTVNSQGILAVVNYSEKDIEDLNTDKGIYLYLDSITDPGNMGTIIRSADAFGVDGIILSPGCVDIYNPKVLRSTMSGVFNVDIYFDTKNVLSVLRKLNFDIVGTFINAENKVGKYQYSDKTVVVMGNEANGISKEVENLCTSKISIPMVGKAESLNVSIACGIMLYDVMVNKIN